MTGLWLSGLIILVVGYQGSQKKLEVKKASSEKKLDAFADKIDEHIMYLEGLYLGHLKSLATQSYERRLRDLEEKATDIVGVVALSELSIDGKTNAQHLSVDNLIPLTLRPTWKPGVSRSLSQSRYFSKENFLNPEFSEEWGWKAGPNGHLYYWRVIRLEKEPSPSETYLRVITVHKKTITDTISKNLSQKLGEENTSIQLEPGFDHLIDPQGAAVFGVGDLIADRKPNERRVFSSVFGTWALNSWDDISSKQFTDYSLLTFSIIGALAFFATGVFVYSKMSGAFKAAEQRVSFVNAVSHELGTPLTNIMLNLDLASDRADELHDKFSKKLMHNAQQECSRLGRLIHNVLTFSQLSKKTYAPNLKEVDLERNIYSAARNFSDSFHRKNIDLDIYLPTLPKVLGDEDRIIQILTNLLSNIEKYGDANSKAAITGSLQQNRISIVFTNEGPSIPKDLSEKIFAPYFRIDGASTSGVAGTGIGLSISRNLAQIMDGDLTNIPNDSGASFELKLKLFTKPS